MQKTGIIQEGDKTVSPQTFGAEDEGGNKSLNMSLNSCSHTNKFNDNSNENWIVGILGVYVIQAFECIAQVTLDCFIGRKRRLKFSSQLLQVVAFSNTKDPETVYVAG